MKKMIALATLALSTAVAAPAWEYAQYTDIRGVGAAFTTPTGSVSGKNLTEVLTAMKCDRQGVIGLLNCAGLDGWELVAINTEAGQFPATTYVFKRQKP